MTMGMNPMMNPMMAMNPMMMAAMGMQPFGQGDDSDSSPDERHHQPKAQAVVAQSSAPQPPQAQGPVNSTSAPADAASEAIQQAMMHLDQNRAQLYQNRGDNMKITRSACALRNLPKAGAGMSFDFETCHQIVTRLSEKSRRKFKGICFLLGFQILLASEGSNSCLYPSDMGPFLSCRCA